MPFLRTGQPLPGALIWFVSLLIHFYGKRHTNSPEVHRCHETQKAPTQERIISWDTGSPLTVSSTDLSFHIWSNRNGGPDGWVDAKKHQPDQHASPDSQVTELQKKTHTQAGPPHWHRRATWLQQLHNLCVQASLPYGKIPTTLKSLENSLFQFPCLQMFNNEFKWLVTSNYPEDKGDLATTADLPLDPPIVLEGPSYSSPVAPIWSYIKQGLISLVTEHWIDKTNNMFLFTILRHCSFHFPNTVTF